MNIQNRSKNLFQKLSYTLTAILLTMCIVANSSAEDQQKQKPTKLKLKLTKLEQKFQKTMSGATLVGHFTIEGVKGNKPAADKYTLGKVTKLKGDYWQFQARIQYLNQDVNITLPPIKVKWAGDTPVISVTDFGVPILGTYSARVLIYDGHYAGTWSGKDHGGLMYGKIILAKPKKNEPKKK